MPDLEIKNLHAQAGDKQILRGVDLLVREGEVHALMGPNGSGKSTLSYVLAGREDYEVTDGDVLFNGESILELDPAERAAKGLFLAFQYPVEIPGVATMQFLKVAMNEQRKARGAALNRLKVELEAAVEARRAELEAAALDARLAAERLDVTLPPRPHPPAGAAPRRAGADTWGSPRRWYMRCPTPWPPSSKARSANGGRP